MMTYDDAVSVLAVMMAAWPSTKSMSDDAAGLWVNDLQNCELAPALKALDRMRHTDEYPPTLARFLGAYQAIEPRTFHEAKALPAPVFGDKAPLVHALRAGVKMAKTNHSNHHKVPGKDCPVCSLHDHDPSGKSHLASCRRCQAFGDAIFEEMRERGFVL
jgi:hypothetical protein